MYWEEPQKAIGYANTLHVNNYNEISKGIGSARIDEIKSIRNFITHPNERTRPNFEQIARNRMMLGLSPDRMLTQQLSGGETLFETWVDQLLIAAWNSIE